MDQQAQFNGSGSTMIIYGPRWDLYSIRTKHGITRQVNSSNSTDDVSEYFLQDKIGDVLWIYISPLLLLVGTVSNVLSVLVLLRKSMRRSTTMFYLTCLSLGDLFTLYTGLLRYWIRTAFDKDVRIMSSVGCKIHVFLVYLSLDFTVWVLVSVTVDRCLSVSLPFKSRRICTLWRCKIVVCVILIILTLKNMHFLWNLEVLDLWELRCDGKSESVRHFISFVWPWIDFSTFCLIPFSIMILCNIKIIYEMVQSQNKLKSHRSSDGKAPTTPTQAGPPAPVHKVTPTHAGDRTHPVTPPISKCDVTAMTERAVQFREPDHVTNNNTASPQKRKQPRTLSTLTAMLLTVNCVFLVTTTPIQAFLIGEQYWFPDKTPAEIAWHNFWWALVNMLQYSNNCIHFFLYCLTGPRFRYELKCMIQRKHRVSTVGEFVSGTVQ